MLQLRHRALSLPGAWAGALRYFIYARAPLSKHPTLTPSLYPRPGLAKGLGRFISLHW